MTELVAAGDVEGARAIFSSADEAITRQICAELERTGDERNDFGDKLANALLLAGADEEQAH